MHFSLFHNARLKTPNYIDYFINKSAIEAQMFLRWLKKRPKGVETSTFRAYES